MKQLLILVLALVLTVMLFAEDDPVQAYLQNPSIQSFNAAVQQLTEDAQKESESTQASLYLAYIANQEARRILSDSMDKLDSLSSGELFFLGNIYLGMDSYADAVRVYDRINASVPKWSCPWRHKGEALFKSGNFAAAAVALEESIKTNENHYDAYVWYAKTLYELKRYNEALVALEKAFALDAEEEDSLFDEELSGDELQTLYKNLKELTK
ncbi:MAG TPA: tetratricopeptide repeat protein [Candidatus Cloacimonadota bacterium]|nr:tetratricopeptide repeat protein [Candidatus Cloacimonadota bacterium]